MRRPEKVGGVIRPRTLGLGRSAVPEPPPPPPPPPPPSILQNKKVIYGILTAVFLLAMLYMMRGGRSGAAPVLAEHGEDESLNGGASLRTGGSRVDDDEEDAEDESETSKVKPSKKAAEEDDDDRGADEEGDASDDPEEKGLDEEEEQPKDELVVARTDQSKNRGSSSDSSRDRSKTVESYFVNFGGRVVDIDKEGSYKYVLVKMEDMFGNKALVVRGCPHREGTQCKHGDAFNRAKAELDLRGFKSTILGGGRITRHPSRHQKGQKAGYISVFGYSKTFGSCADCNKLACSLIKTSFPDHGIKWANEGYLESDERKVRDEAWTRC